MDCAYCSDVAKGYDEEGEPTCGAESCAPVTAPFPRVIEVSSDDDETDETEGTEK